MALFPTRAELIAAIKDDCQRPNHAAFTAAIPRFIAGAESRIYDGGTDPLPTDPLRVRVMEVVTTVTAISGTVDMPDDFLEAKSLVWSGSTVTAPDYMPPSEFREQRYTTGSGSPVAYTIEGPDTMLISPATSGDLVLLYYARPAAMTSDSSANAVLTAYPMIYFHACRIEAYDYLRNNEMRQAAAQSYASALGGIMRQQRKARVSGNRLVPRVPNWRL